MTRLPVKSNDEDDEKTVAALLAEMDHLRKMMDADQVEIERLKLENRDLMAETRAMLKVLKAAVVPGI